MMWGLGELNAGGRHVTAGNLRAVLAADSEFGVGNVLLKLAEPGARMDVPRVTFDADVAAVAAYAHTVGARPRRIVPPAQRRSAAPLRIAAISRRAHRGGIHRQGPQVPHARAAGGQHGSILTPKGTGDA
jgi:hypothetical protein